MLHLFVNIDINSMCYVPTCKTQTRRVYYILQRVYMMQFNITFSVISVILWLYLYAADVVLLSTCSVKCRIARTGFNAGGFPLSKPTVFPWSNLILLSTKQGSTKSYGVIQLGIESRTSPAQVEHSTTRPPRCGFCILLNGNVKWSDIFSCNTLFPQSLACFDCQCVTQSSNKTAVAVYKLKNPWITCSVCK